MWDELGIAPTTDIKTIRRAYAARLRTIDADLEPAAFQRLRSAYENALHRAAKPPRRALETATFVGSGEISPAIPAPLVHRLAAGPLQEDLDAAETRAALNVIRAALASRLYDEAFAAYDSGLAKGSFALYQRESVLDGMMQVIVSDKTVSPNAFCYFMKRAGWQTLPPARLRLSRARAMASERMEAEMWFMRMQDLADGDPVPMPPHKRRIALLLLVKLRLWLHRRIERRNAHIFFGSWQFWHTSRTSVEDLRRKLSQYHRYENWLKERFEPENIARADRILRWRAQWEKYALTKWAGRAFAICILIGFVIFALQAPGTAGLSGMLLGLIAYRCFRWLKALLGFKG